MKIALCAGHTEDKRGAVNKKYELNEHHEALALVWEVYVRLVALGHDVAIIGGDLKTKVEAINNGNFDFCFDFHFNADADHLDPDDFNDERGHGIMIMYCPQNDEYGHAESDHLRKQQSDEMSGVIAGKLDKRNLGGRPGWHWGSNPPTKKDYFLRKTNCSAFIPELGYIDNNKFAKDWLMNEKHPELAQAFVDGFSAMIGANK